MKLSIRRIVALLGWLVVCGRGLLVSGEPPADPFQAPFERMSGRELVEQLTDKKARSRAFYELYRRSIKDDASAAELRYRDRGYELFVRLRYGAEVTVVPQKDEVMPLYIVTYNGLRWEPGFRIPEDGNYRVPRRGELFPPIAEPQQGSADNSSRNFDVFSGEGKRLYLFGSDSVTPETFANVTGDGRLAIIETENCGLDGADSLNIRTLQVMTVEEKPRTLLYLLLNWNTDNWTHRVRDTDGDGIAEIEIGPRTKAGIKPMVIFRWHKPSQKFVSTKLGTSDHFRLLTDDPFSAFAKYRKEKLRFSSSPGTLSEDEASQARLTTSVSAKEQAFPNQLPKEFWKLDAKASTVAFAEVNRSAGHRNGFRLGVEDRDGSRPPQDGAVMLTEHSQGCFGGSETAWFLRIDPELSYLVSGRNLDPTAISSRGRPFSGDLEIKRIPYDQAKQVGAVLWWLDRIRTHPEDMSAAMGMSTTSHYWWLSIRDSDGNLALGRAETSTFPGWNGAFTRKVYLEYAAWLLRHAFLAPDQPATPPDRVGRVAKTPDDHPCFETARQILTWWTPDEKQVSHSLTTAAAQVVAGTKDVEVLNLLRKIAAQLPPEKDAAAATNSLAAQGWEANEESRKAKGAFLAIKRPAPSEIPALEEKQTAMQEKSADLWFRVSAKQAVNGLRQAVDDALAKSSQDPVGTKGPAK